MFQRLGKCPRLIQQFCFSSSILVLEKRAIIAVIDAHFDGLFPRSSLARQRSAPFFPSVLQPCATMTATLCFSSVLLFDTAVAEMIAILGTLTKALASLLPGSSQSVSGKMSMGTGTGQAGGVPTSASNPTCKDRTGGGMTGTTVGCGNFSTTMSPLMKSLTKACDFAVSLESLAPSLRSSTTRDSSGGQRRIKFFLTAPKVQLPYPPSSSWPRLWCGSGLAPLCAMLLFLLWSHG